MESQKVKKLVSELVELMETHDLTEMKIIEGDTEIMLKRAGQSAMPQVLAIPPAMAPSNADAAPAISTDPAAAAAPGQQEGLIEISSPMVGTFYSAPSPNADPFVEVGSQVDEETTVCVIEAMKVMNEIKADAPGAIKKVLVTNGASVEYGQPLFLVEPA